MGLERMNYFFTLSLSCSTPSTLKQFQMKETRQITLFLWEVPEKTAGTCSPVGCPSVWTRRELRVSPPCALTGVLYFHRPGSDG